MQADQILVQLNEQQREAVTSSGSNVMVVAGAGSGKTRVLVHRIAWLIAVEQIPPQNIFAVTFTNKAAKEMSSRVSKILGYESKGMWIGTFHGIAHRFLRLHWSDADLDQNFQILDADDQLRQIKKIIKESSFDESRYPPKEITWFINSQKDLGLRPDRSKGKKGFEHYVEIYAAYERLCRQNNLVDFGELLLRFYETLKNNDPLLKHYQNRFENILVDEFQDTNEIQYQIIKLITGSEGRAFIVGDDDQSIYRWRGANPDSMPRFRNDFLDPRSIKLEQNYRSTKNILNAANSIISNNNGRLEKNLWTDEESGPLIKLHQNFDEYEEASNIIETIESKSGKIKLSDIAVLYRSNAQSRVIEEALIRRSIPYRVYGGFRFFDRAEVKDALAYLRLTQNIADDIAFERACSVPPKGIGAQTMDKIKNHAKDEGLCLYASSDQLIQGKTLANRATKSLGAFLGGLNETKNLISDQTLEKQFEIVIEQSKLIPHLKEKKTEQSATKIDNILELINAAHGFRQPFEDDDLTPMQSFLAHAALESGENQASEWQESVQLMTMHSAKGLEFPLVFIAGMEDGLFPHTRSQLDPGGLEEERRLCYVAVTRSMRELYISYSSQRMLHGNMINSQPSRFLYEIPNELIDDLSNEGLKPMPKRSRTNGGDGLLGKLVKHSSFGEGVVIAVEGDGDNKRVQVNFQSEGLKWRVLGYANLKIM